MLVVCLCFLNVYHYRLELENLNSVFSDHFWRFKSFYSKVWAVRWFFPLYIIVRSTANKNPLDGLDRFVITSFMAMRNRLTLRTDPCGTPFSMVLNKER